MEWGRGAAPFAPSSAKLSRNFKVLDRSLNSRIILPFATRSPLLMLLRRFFVASLFVAMFFAPLFRVYGLVANIEPIPIWMVVRNLPHASHMMRWHISSGINSATCTDRARLPTWLRTEYGRA
jgi:hypothetical protein